jgi:hypothetical protein
MDVQRQVRPGHTVFTLLLPLREAEEAGND